MRSQSNPGSSTDVGSYLKTMPPIGRIVTDLPLEVIKEKPPQASPTPNIVNIKRGPRKQTSNVSNEVETPKMASHQLASFKRREKPPTLQQALKTDSSLSHLERKAVKLVDESKFRGDVESADPDTTLHSVKRKAAEMALDAVLGAPDEQPYDNLTNEERQQNSGKKPKAKAAARRNIARLNGGESKKRP